MNKTIPSTFSLDKIPVKTIYVIIIWPTLSLVSQALRRKHGSAGALVVLVIPFPVWLNVCTVPGHLSSPGLKAKATRKMMK